VIARTILLVVVAVLSGCAARVPVRPTGTPAPDPAANTAFANATRQCAGLKTLTAELRLSGRAGDERIRGTLIVGLAAPASLRFEAVAPFGAPVFILAGRDNRATLLLPRDNRVLIDAGVADILERLTGLGLAADDLRYILTGCLAERPTPNEGRAWSSGWQAVTVGDGIIAYLRTVDGTPAVVAADHRGWRVDYSDHLNRWPRKVRIRSADGGKVDITAAIDQLEMNVAIDEKAFEVPVPANVGQITLDDLRAVAPLRGSS
jgi:outer membrane biogenesis lipoprotein LolB